VKELKKEGEYMGKYDVKELVETYSDMIMRIAYQNCFNKSDSEDIVQEVFIKLMQNMDNFENNPEYLKAWLIRVTINLSKDYNKSSWYKKVEAINDNDVGYYFNTEEIGLIHELSKLKPIYRNIIYLYYYEGYKINEIAKILNLNENTVSSNLTRARKKLKEYLEVGGESYA
jgi:RNA polymerase sigma-70 factor (ECF subfamily)